MTREEQIKSLAEDYAKKYRDPEDKMQWGEYTMSKLSFVAGAKWADEHPSDETIMRILNAVGYEEKSWIEVVRKHLGENTESDKNTADYARF